VVANAGILLKVAKNNYKLSGGAVAHMGIGLMLIGIMFSAGYSNVVSLNNSGLLLSSDESFTKDNNKENKENTLLWVNQPTKMDDYTVTYRGRRVKVRGVPGYVHKNSLMPGDVPYRAVAKEPIVQEGMQYYAKGDTMTIDAEDIYFEVEYRDQKGRVFTLYPRTQINEQMGGLVSSPDIKHGMARDLYTHVQATPDLSSQEWSPAEEYVVAIQDTFIVNDYIAVLDNVVRASEVEGIVLTSNDAAVKAQIRVLGQGRNYEVSPAYLIKDRMVGRLPEVVEDLGLKFTFTNIDPQREEFTFAVNTTQKDYIIMKAREMPFINVLWIGTGVLVVGFCMAMGRRYSDFRKMRDKGVE
jgi:cytochrome c-type biogenesis protein CcmF